MRAFALWDFFSRQKRVVSYDMSKQNVQNIQDKILLRALDDVAFDGWSLEVVENAAAQDGFEADVVRAVFPAGLGDVLAHLSSYADRMMLEKLAVLDKDGLRIRDYIHVAIMTRFEVLEPYKEALRLSLPYWARPFSQLRGGKIIWRSADAIWNWAGDTSDDYNYYTKRTLLSGILISATSVWLDDREPSLQKTRKFVDKRIENVMQFGKIIGRIKK